MSRNVKKSRDESLEILREYLTTDMSKRAICRKYGLNPNWVYINLIKFAVADKKDGVAMKKLPGNVSVEKTYCDDDRDALLKRIRELEIELRRTEKARDAYDEMIRLAELYYKIPRRKIQCQVVESLSQKARPGGCYTKTALCELLGISRNGYYKHEESEVGRSER